MSRRHRNRISLALVLALKIGLMGAGLALAAPAMTQDDVRAESQAELQPELALMGTIPIYWGEADGFGDLLDRGGETHWARRLIERDFRIAPLD